VEASFSTLVISLGSSAVMAMGLAPNPHTEKTEKNLEMAQFNIDLLLVLRDKSKGNLNAEENRLVDYVISDLQMKFVEAKK